MVISGGSFPVCVTRPRKEAATPVTPLGDRFSTAGGWTVSVVKVSV